jgi:uncharacterized ferritin-like protein (DUF455 family)
MELREFAERILLSERLEEKLAAVGAPFSDDAPGVPTNVTVPGRPPELVFAPRRAAPAMPKPGAFSDPRKVAVAHHIMANHELQALEVMAWVLCRFPVAPREFRFGMTEVIADEQRHTRMHARRCADLGVPFGSLPVNCYIWKKAMAFEDLLDYLSGIVLTFEGRNLDHSLEFAGHFERAGDEKSTALMRVIHEDEIRHVAFGMEWFARLKPAGASDWDVFRRHLKWPLRPAKARGEVFQRAARLAAGMPPELVDGIEEACETSETENRKSQ